MRSGRNTEEASLASSPTQVRGSTERDSLNRHSARRSALLATGAHRPVTVVVVSPAVLGKAARLATSVRVPSLPPTHPGPDARHVISLLLSGLDLIEGSSIPVEALPECSGRNIAEASVASTRRRLEALLPATVNRHSARTTALLAIGVQLRERRPCHVAVLGNATELTASVTSSLPPSELSESPSSTRCIQSDWQGPSTPVALQLTGQARRAVLRSSTERAALSSSSLRVELRQQAESGSPACEAQHRRTTHGRSVGAACEGHTSAAGSTAHLACPDHHVRCGVESSQ